MINKEIVENIPFFNNSEVQIENIYLSDRYPACLLVKHNGRDYKVRIPSEINADSVKNELYSITFLRDNLISTIPEIIDYDISNNNAYHYIIENFLPGNSLDKIYGSLSQKDTELISHSIFKYIESFSMLKNNQFGKLSETNRYDNYGQMLLNRFEKHLKIIDTYQIISFDLKKRLFSKLNDIENAFNSNPTFLHFDIKPQNIIYDRKNEDVFLVDFEHSRFGDVSHELFRGDIAAVKNPKFKTCWNYAKKEFISKYGDYGLRYKSSYYSMFHIVSELSYYLFVGNKQMVLHYMKNLENEIKN